MKLDWDIIFAVLPQKNVPEEEEKRKEMWMLMDLDDSLSMSLSELEKGISTITQSADYFDCYPAIMTAFEYTKNFSIKLQELEEDENANEFEEEDEEKKEYLEYKDFGLFLQGLRQYYIFCQLFQNDEVLEDFRVTKSLLAQGDIKEEIERFTDVCVFDELFLDTCNGYVDFKVFIDWVFEKNLSRDVQKVKKLAELTENDLI